MTKQHKDAKGIIKKGGKLMIIRVGDGMIRFELSLDN